jgi:hypothetical protein
MKKDLLIIAIVFTLISSAFYIFSKFTRGGTDNIYLAWDGPSYIIAAKSLYVPSVAVENNSIQSLDIRDDFTFLPAHFPLYPLLIQTFSFIGYNRAALLLSLTFSLATLFAFYFLAKELRLSHPLLLTLPMIMIPPRWFIMSHTASTEPLFIFFVLLSFLYYFRRSPWLSAITASLALLARPQGTLVGLAFLVIAIVELLKSHDLKAVVRRFAPYLLIPLTLLGIFTFYKYQTGDFWAFFSAISIFHHLSLTLFPTFNSGAPNIETFWQEVNAVYYFVYLAAIIELFRSKKWQLGILGVMFYLPLIVLQHSDISRYALPLMPLAFIAFADVISKKSITWASFLSIPAIFLYTANFILNNRAH